MPRGIYKHPIGSEANHWLGGKHSVVCLWCDRKFTVFSYRAKSAKYCSFTCKGLYYEKVGKLRGVANPSWKGGISRDKKKERLLVMELAPYRRWRVAVFVRDGFRCLDCG